jgi:15-cis-phytoene synthase
MSLTAARETEQERQRASDDPANERESIERHSRSFSLAASLLPPLVARDVRRLYAWCRACDNAVDDESVTLEERRARLDRIRADLRRVYAGERLESVESGWLQELVERYAIPEEWPRALLDGMESDLDFVRPASQTDLELYCYRAAGVVGLMMSRILGTRSREAEQYACSLGIAMQLTNIARDVAEDWERGRCYLPEEWLATDTAELPSDAELCPVVERLLNLAEHHYELGRKGYPYLPLNVRWAIRVAASVYREIGEVIRRAGYRVREQRHFVPTGRKLRIVAAGLGAGVRDRASMALGNVSNSLMTGVTDMKPETFYLAIFGLSLTCVMGTVMFALVGMNPKADSYDKLPWVYSIGCAVMAAVLGWWSRRLASKLPVQ